jgi:hypothetical protein
LKNKFFVVLALLAVVNSSAFAIPSYPDKPNPTITPGALCAKPDDFRYDEKIPYCKRDVDSSTKQAIIKNYDATFGYKIAQMNRADFKIDHYIPLCMGGSNEISNLWPQHASVFKITDPIEQVACVKMGEGKLLQSKAIEILKQAKADLSLAPKLGDYLQSL